MINKLQRIGVFCGAHSGNHSNYGELARRLGYALVQENIGLVYGGGNVGIMGEVSNAVLERGGEVIGVIPEMLVKKERASGDITQLHIVKSMRERKALISKLSDAFIMLPGGVGTLDEFFEVYCLAKLGVHHKPCAILNVNNFYDPIISFLRQAQHGGFLDTVSLDMIIIEESPEVLLQKCMNYQSPYIKIANTCYNL